MKLLLSRKGFDSGSGKLPSPIFPDGSMVSFPIPDEHSKISYQIINGQNGGSIGNLVEELTKGKILGHFNAHLDPDLYEDSIKRERGWRPIFGQTGAAQGHLLNNQVGQGDLFLFFGRFQNIVESNRKIKYDNSSKSVHVIFGWLQVNHHSLD